MLKQRVITALIIAPILIAIIIWSPLFYLKLFFGSLILLAAWEWSKLAGLTSGFAKMSFLFSMAVALYVLDYIFNQYDIAFWLCVIAATWWFGVALVVVTFDPNRACYNCFRLLSLMVGLVTLSIAWLALVGLHKLDAMGVYYILYVCLLVSAADIGAYFVGRRFGRRPLAAKLSPGKTLEGAIGGLLSVLLLAVLAIMFFDFAEKELAFILLSLFVAVFSIIGDLFESLVKRVAGVKDSGAILPGHGGVLDRIDSAIAAMPIFYAGSVFLL